MLHSFRFVFFPAIFIVSTSLAELPPYHPLDVGPPPWGETERIWFHFTPPEVMSEKYLLGSAENPTSFDARTEFYSDLCEGTRATFPYANLIFNNYGNAAEDESEHTGCESAVSSVKARARAHEIVSDVCSSYCSQVSEQQGDSPLRSEPHVVGAEIFLLPMGSSAAASCTTFDQERLRNAMSGYDGTRFGFRIKVECKLPPEPEPEPEPDPEPETDSDDTASVPPA